MDEASQLVSELQHKLAELDQKVWRYRQNMASEFDKYLEGLLRDVPTDVSETVSKTIADSLTGYTSLYPAASIESSLASTSPGPRLIPNGGNQERPASPSSRHPQPQEDPEVARSPHARDLEFRGVFTPNYLPLLDNSHQRRSSYDSASPAPVQAERKMKEPDPLHIDASTSTRTSASSSSSELRRPPTPKRRNTDEASIQSDGSDGPVRRSALRRSSSSSKGLSPRRVRFEVAGEEVLPTSSPAPAESMLSEANSSNSLLDSDDEPEQIEDIDEPLQPKRISSSQALRALSRSPLADDGTQWITVSAPPDGSASVATTNGFSKDEDFDDEDLAMDSGILGMNIKSPPPKDIPVTDVEVPARTTDDDGDETPSDDEMLDMPPLRRQSASSASMLSPTIPANIDNNTPPTASSCTSDKPPHVTNGLNDQEETLNEEDPRFDENDNDDLFHFDEHPPNERPHYLPEPEEPEPASPTMTQEELALSLYSRSPALEIVKPPPAKVAIPKSSGLVGSYKGHPFSMPIVSPEVHAQAASMGPVSSFVGSVHGRTGPDESDVQSFRASGLGSHSFTGMPRSMSERMMLDDLVEAEEERRG